MLEGTATRQKKKATTAPVTAPEINKKKEREREEKRAWTASLADVPSLVDF